MLHYVAELDVHNGFGRDDLMVHHLAEVPVQGPSGNQSTKKLVYIYHVLQIKHTFCSG